MVKSERDADAKVPTKVMNTGNDTIIAPMANNILLFTFSIMVNRIYIID
jgi:hypothetical protein